MFDWLKFVVLGKELIGMETEESIRTAISRMYYGIFGVVRRYLVNVSHKYFLMKPYGDVHKKVYGELINSKDTSEQEIAHILNRLRG